MKNKQGFLFPMVMIFMALLFALGSGITLLVFPDFFFFRRSAAVNSAIHLANAGVQEALAKLNNGSIPADNSTTGTPYTFSSRTSIVPVTYGSYSVSVRQINTGDGGIPAFQITSTSTLNTNPQIGKQVQAVARIASLSDYMSFTNQELSGDSYGPSDVIEGPIRSNDNINIWFSDTPVGSPPVSGKPLFKSTVASAQNLIWTLGTPPTASQYNEMFTEGSAAAQSGAASIAWPVSNNFSSAFAAPRQTALGSNSPSADGLYLSSGGGIYTQGIGEVIFSLNSGNQVMNFLQSDKINWEVTLLPQSNSCSVHYVNTTAGSQANTTNTYNYLPKPVVYCARWNNAANNWGGVKLSGTVKWQGTLYCEGDANYDGGVFINDNLVEDIDNDGALEDGEGKLGIVSSRVYLSSKTPVNTIVQASIVGTENASYGNATSGVRGSFGVASGPVIQDRGALNLTGSMFLKNQGVVKSSYRFSTRNFKYDQRLNFSPPPYFPTQAFFPGAANPYSIRLWKMIR